MLLLHQFRVDHKATEATSNICSTMGKDVLSIRTAQHWFHRFKRRPSQMDIELLKQLIEEDPRITPRCLAGRLGCSHTTAETYLRELGKTCKYGVWIPHNLSPQQLQHRVDACMELLTSHRNKQWLRNLVTVDEKWVLYINYAHWRQWLSVSQTGVATRKTDLHPKTVMLSIWWGIKGVIHWGTFPNGCTITVDLYCQQLDRVVAKLQGSSIEYTFYMTTPNLTSQSQHVKND